MNPPPPTSLAALAWVSLGSNLGDSVLVVRQALDRLQALSDQPLLRSSLWRTQPVDCPPGSPWFVNAVAGLAPRPDETPESLLAQLQALERAFGRQPTRARNEPRPLDLDLIAFGNQVRSSACLTLPHPRAHLRRFVLDPLGELAPDLVFPGQSQSVRQLLAALGGAQSTAPLAAASELNPTPQAPGPNCLAPP